MPNPGAFQGSRKEFLVGEKEAYSQAVDGGYTSEALALICRRYFKRYPIDLPHNTEPSAEHLAAIDDNTPDPEIQEPDVFAMSREDYNIAMEQLKQCKMDIDFRKAQIKRWMAYQYMKDHHIDPRETGSQNPYRVLFFRLTNRGVNRPRKKSTVNVWRKTHCAEIEHELRIRHGPGVPKKQLAALRDKIAREIFAKLDDETRHEWQVLATEEHAVALEQWLKDLDSPPSTDPRDRQRSIQGLVSFIQPILDMICEVTGWKVTLIAGGPEPAQDGQLNIISIHAGTTSGDVKMTFGIAERANIKKFLIPMFGSFLQKCFSPEECRARALPTQGGHLQLSQLELESSNITLHSISRKNTGTSSQGASATTPSALSQQTTTTTTVTPPTQPSLPPSLPTTNSASDSCQEPLVNDPAIVTTTTDLEPEISESRSQHEEVLAREANTLLTTSSPPEDEVQMTLSRSASPAFTPVISPAPSPPPSRCPSPEGELLSDATVQGLAMENGAKRVSPVTPAPTAAALADTSDIPMPGAATTQVPDNGGPLARRSSRSVKKTSKLVLLEEAETQWGKKRGAEVLADGDSIVNQAPVQRGRVGKKGRKRA